MLDVAGHRYGDHPTFYGASEIMIPFLAIHALAAPRGEGLRPELLVLFERYEATLNPHLIVAVSDQHLADAAETANPHPMIDMLPHKQKA